MGGLGEAGEQAVLEHRPGALAGLLAGLGDHHQRARPLVLIAASRRAVPSQAAIWVSWPQACMMPVSTPVGRLARPWWRRAGRSARSTGKRVHVGAQHQHRARARCHHRDDAGAADLVGDGEAELAHLGRQQAGAARLLHAELGIGVEVAIERHQLRHVGADRLVERRRPRPARRGMRGGEQGQHATVHVSARGTSSITSSVDSKWG